MPARLIVHPSVGPAAELILEESRDYVIGREPDCEVRLDDDRVSRHHARLSPRGAGRWRLTDLGSKNGLTLDGEPVQAADLAGTAWIGFGGLRARFEPLAPDAAAAAREDELQRRRTSLDLQRRLDPAEGLGPLLHRVLDSVLSVSGAERGFVVLTRETGGLELAATAELGAEEIAGEEFSGSAGAVERAVATGRPVVLSDAGADTYLGARPSVVSGGIRALVCLPLAVLGRVLGAVYADSREPGRTFTRLDVEILQGFTSHAALALAVAQLQREVAGLGEKIRGEKIRGEKIRGGEIRDGERRADGLGADVGHGGTLAWAGLAPPGPRPESPADE